MKTPAICHRMLLICVLLLGSGDSLLADVTNPNAPAPPPGSRIKKDTGLFSRLFGRKAEKAEAARPSDNDDDDDDDDHRKPRPRASRPQLLPSASGTIITSPATAVDRGSVSSKEKGTPGIAPLASGAASVAQGVDPASPSRASRATRTESGSRTGEPVRTSNVSSKAQSPPSSTHAARSSSRAASDARNATASSNQPSASQTSARTSSGGPSAQPSSTEAPASPPDAPFATPVPGRPGFAYPPGQEPTPKNMIDVSGYAPGTKVRDPESNVVFRVP